MKLKAESPFVLKQEPVLKQELVLKQEHVLKQEPIQKHEPVESDCSAKQPASIPKKSINMALTVLQRLKSETNPKIWEKHVSKALPVLDTLEPVCKDIASSPKLNPEIKAAADHWVKLIANVRERSTKTNNIIIGVFGNTGDGKSSTINALLGESSLLPTNCMRACTACVTEISHNDEDDATNPYRAEIDFVSPDEWMQDITEFLREVEAQEGEFDWDDDEPDSDAAKAVAKARAVYANMADEVLLRSSAVELIRHPSVHGLLGTTKTFKAPTADELRCLVEPYIDSSDKDESENEKPVSFWPMVKAVRIFTKAKALSNGVTIVDLPGLQDSDAARASIASDYMKSCAGIWIVAPIHRAVDNKTAKDLMSDSFKRQLKLDESFSSVTFICSKTDELKVLDAVKNLKKKLRGQTTESWDEARRCTQRIKLLENQVKKLRTTKTKTAEPDDESNQSNDERPTKRIKTDLHEEKSKELERCRLKRDELLQGVRADCIQLRNDLSRDNLKEYFSRVVKEALQQTEVARNGEGKNDEAKFLDYQEMTDNLPVFCVSSHAFQAFEGLAEEDTDSTAGFINVEDTEIPQLQAHAQKLTEELRVAKNKEVLAGICRLLNSIALWTQDKPEFAAGLDIETLNSLLAELEKNLLALTELCINSLEKTMENELYNRMDLFGAAANFEAVGTADGWCAPPGEGGLYHSTLKATFARNGAWKARNFNEELLEAFSTKIQGHWVENFRMNVPTHLDDFILEVRPMLKDFHQSILRQLGDYDDEGAQVTTQLQKQVQLHQDSVRRLIAESKAGINEAQKLASREPQRIVLEYMTPGYNECKIQTGKGSVQRMKIAITEHIEACKGEMFEEAIEEAKGILQKSVEDFSERLRAEVRNVIQTMRSDYTMALAKREQSSRREEAVFKEGMMVVLELAQPLVK